MDEDESDPAKRVYTEFEEVALDLKAKSEIESFREEVSMIKKLKRAKIRKELKEEKLDLLVKVLEINKKLEILDKLDEKKS